MIEADTRPPATAGARNSPAPPNGTAPPLGKADVSAMPEVPVRDVDERSVNLGRRFFNAKTAVSFLIGIAILIAVFRVTSIHPAEILAQLRQIDPVLYLLAIVTYATTFAFRGLRWQRLLANVGCRLPLVPLTEVIFLSWFVNSVVPAKLGDVYRGYLLRREFGLSMSRTVGTVVAERVLDILALILLLGSTGFFVLRTRASVELC